MGKLEKEMGRETTERWGEKKEGNQGKAEEGAQQRREEESEQGRVWRSELVAGEGRERLVQNEWIHRLLETPSLRGRGCEDASPRSRWQPGATGGQGSGRAEFQDRCRDRDACGANVWDASAGWLFGLIRAVGWLLWQSPSWI